MNDLNNHYEKYCGTYIVEHPLSTDILPVESYILSLDGLASWNIIDADDDENDDINYSGTWTMANNSIAIVFERPGSLLIEEYLRKGEFFEDTEIAGRYLRKLPKSDNQ